MPLLSAAIIARDEQLMLPDCLASLQGIADEVVVLDTGSVDLTREIAEAAGAIVDTLAWTGNFATARNAAIDRCSGEWILYIDCDERIRPGTAGNLRASLRDASAIGYQVRFHVRPALTPYWELRLFRNDPALRFEGVIHENIWPALLRLVDTQVFDVRRLPLTIDHIGYEANQERKNARNLPLLQQAVQSDPDHVYCWAELGRIHYERGDLPGARDALWKGANVVRSKAAVVGQDSLPFAWLARIGMETGDPAPAPVIAEAQALFPEHPQLIWLQGQLALRNKSFDEAAACFQTLAKVDADAFIDAAMAYDHRLFGAWPIGGLAACHLATRHYADAAALFADAARLDPTDVEYRVKQAMANRLADGIR